MLTKTQHRIPAHSPDLNPIYREYNPRLKEQPERETMRFPVPLLLTSKNSIPNRFRTY
jgi:hypothetical protein